MTEESMTTPKGEWTEAGIKWVLAYLKGNAKHSTQSDAAEIIEQLQKKLEATEAERAKRDRAMADFLKRATNVLGMALPKLDHPDDWGDFEEAGLEPLKALYAEFKAAALKEQERGTHQ